MSRLKVVVYTGEFPSPNDPAGAVFTERLVRELGAHVDVTVVCPLPWSPSIGWLKGRGDWGISAGVPRHMTFRGMDVYYPVFPVIPWFSRVFLGLTEALWTFALMRRLKRAGKVEVVNAHFIYPDGVAAAVLSRLLGLPLVLTALGSDINVYAGLATRRVQIEWALRRANATTAVSRALLDRIRALGADEARLHHIPTGVDQDRFSPLSGSDKRRLRVDLGLREDGRYLVFIGRLHPVKGLDCLVSALGMLRRQGGPGFHTVLVGDGSQRQVLERQAAAQAPGCITFAGAADHDRVADWMRAADVLCLPSRMEGLPNVVLEAHACGIPVVASRVGGIPEQVNDDNGILVPPGDARALAEALARAFERRWDAGVIRRSVQWADWKVTAQAYVDLYRDACAEGRVQP